MIDTRELEHRNRWERERRDSEPITTEPKPDQKYTSAEPGGPPPVSPAERLVNLYVHRAMLRAATKQYEEDGTWFAEIRAIPDVWGDGETEAVSLETLESVLREWLEWKIQDRDGDIPVIDSVDLNKL